VSLRVAVRALAAVLRRPALWPTAFRQFVVLSPPRWWRSGARRPGPPPDYLRFRLVTQYGGDGSARGGRSAESRDVVNYLAWCRDWRKTIRSHEG